MRRNTNRLFRILLLFIMLITLDVLPIPLLRDFCFAINGLLAVGFFLDLTLFLFFVLFVSMSLLMLNGQLDIMLVPVILIPVILKIVSQYTTSKERVYLLTMFLGVVAIQIIITIASVWPGVLLFLKLIFINSLLTLMLYSIARTLMVYQLNSNYGN